MRFSFLLCSLALFPLAAACQNDPVLQGRITRFASLHDFDVNGRHITFAPGALVFVRTSRDSAITVTEGTRIVVGEPATIYGTDRGRRRPLRATRVEVTPLVAHTVEGVAVIESVTRGSALEVGADGYRIRLGPATKTEFEKPLATIADVAQGQVIRYKGTLQTDGAVLAESILVGRYDISKRALKLRAEWEYDPATVPKDSKQNGADKFLRGRDASYFPTHDDEAMLARVRGVGERLVPDYQKKLADGDPERLSFRFYLVDAPKAQQAFPLPSGIILVPYQAVARLQSDAQLAAMLGDAIACLIEQQPIPLPLTNGQLTLLGGITAAEIVPVAGTLVSAFVLEQSLTGARLVHHNQEQRARVSLSLMQRAGFDVMQAPVAWWILASNPKKALTDVDPPDHAVSLYSALNELQAFPSGVDDAASH